ncbi:DUF4276 family protein [Alkalimarinus coralli]|uniref:DUF4276 family protein n=1 Tax=Alkalimarinus coralli TaxID=2935863 RepID=UPI00202B5EAB|nr:DUF4276 family protein [Alkalimarinus coralli]
MHYEILVEGQCELTALSIIMSRILGEYAAENTWKIHKHQGVGKIPDDVSNVNPNDRSLLGQLPAKIRAYNSIDDESRAVVVLLDLDGNDKDEVMSSLEGLIPEDSNLKIEFCFAIEELEAWFLGDQNAIQLAYPNTDNTVVRAYVQDSICGTWETLARAVLSNVTSLPKRDRRVLMEKCEWAKRIPPFMDIDANLSPSFQSFKDSLLGLAA